MAVLKIISGGQTGADRAALDFAMSHNLDCGGYCPKGRCAEDGVIDLKYPLTESPSSFYQERTRLNIIHSEATALFIVDGVFGKGSLFTKKQCLTNRKPLLIVDLTDNAANLVAGFTKWISENKISILNIAGNREGTSPGIYRLTTEFLMLVHQNTEVFCNEKTS
ncbi:MAG TPA: putative molybdenum carrier protein [Bacteroidales bacterium]|nr:putative molybdenum carrier protein [Bacteroidales bacterium]HQP04445.1 putative molybdenum carrier protein [Bacteroidales bacterium]